MLKEAKYYLWMTYYYQQFLRTKPIADPAGALKEGIAKRVDHFLSLVRQAAFDNPTSPYSALLRGAQCNWQDLHDEVKRHGLEPTLIRLRNAGVYLSHAEVKGGPVVRHGQEIANFPGACRSPLAGRGLKASSSGSRSVGLESQTSTEWRVYREAYETLCKQEFDLPNRTEISMMPILPALWGITTGATAHRIGGRFERWFSMAGTLRSSAHYRAVTHVLCAEARLLGVRVPFPEYLDPGDFTPVLDALIRARDSGRPAFVRATVSSVTRVCTAAIETGRDISGTIFLTAGEALTDGRRRTVEAAGCLAFPRYLANEIGPIGFSCRHMSEGNTVHHLHDSSAVIVVRRPAPLAPDIEVDSLHFTTIHPHASNFWINAEIDDAGTLRPATCDCTLSRAGFTTAITNVASFGKLTGYGMTLLGSQILTVLETRLPARLGGSPVDFQLVEKMEQRQMELSLFVHPRLGHSPEHARAVFLEEVGKVFGGGLSRRTWEHAGSLKVVVAPPVATRTGKVLQLRLASFGGPAQ